MCCGATLQWCMVPSHTAQHSTALHHWALRYTLHMTQILVDDAGETLIGYTDMDIVTYFPRLTHLYVVVSPMFVYLRKQDIKKKKSYNTSK